MTEEGWACTHARGFIAHNSTYTGNVWFTTAPDMAWCHSEHCGHEANHALNPMDADDKTTNKLTEEGTLVDEAVWCHTVERKKDTEVTNACFVIMYLSVMEETLGTTETTDISTQKGYVHVVLDGMAHHCMCSPLDHGKSLGKNTDEPEVGYCDTQPMGDSKEDLSDPASRKLKKEGELHRELLRSDGCLGRYTERLATLKKHSGDETDTYVGGEDSTPLYYENETVQSEVVNGALPV